MSTKRKKHNFPRASAPRQLFSRRFHRTIEWLLSLALCAWVASAWPAAGPGQKDKKRGAEEEFLVFGTVFTEQGFSLPGAEVIVRRAGEKKVRWRAQSDRRGEFAVRLPGGADYEVTVTARDFAVQRRRVKTVPGGREDFVFRMQPAAGEKERKKKS